MEQQFTIHIVGGTSRSRAEQARIAFAIGCHAEVYDDLAELLVRPVGSGVVIAGGALLEEGVGQLIACLGEAGMWLPVVAVCEQPCVQDVVRAMEEGAFDFLALPLEHGDLSRTLAKLEGAAQSHVTGRRITVEAQRRIATLSPRERQVLDWLAEGCSNKLIARELDISPRTVEIHRANMMIKLDVQHAAEAVRMQCVAGLESTARSSDQEGKSDGAASFRLVPTASDGAGIAAPLRRAA